MGGLLNCRYGNGNVNARLHGHDGKTFLVIHQLAPKNQEPFVIMCFWIPWFRERAGLYRIVQTYP
jgi:hypothetical protein